MKNILLLTIIVVLISSFSCNNQEEQKDERILLQDSMIKQYEIVLSKAVEHNSFKHDCDSPFLDGDEYQIIIDLRTKLRNY